MYKITELDKQYILDNYKKTTQQKIANKIGCSKVTVSRFLQLNNLTTPLPKYKYDNTYFDKIDTHNKAYVVGFILADGCVHHTKKKRYVITIALSIKDECILKFIKKELKAEFPITHFSAKTHKYCRLQINSKKLHSSIVNLGIMPRKTYLNEIPKIPKQFRNSFLLGYFDGDGCIGYYKNTHSNTFQQEVLFVAYSQKFLSKIRKYCNLEHLGNINKYKTHFTWKIGARQQCIEIYNYMYGNTDFYLKRKHDKFLKFV